MGDETRRLMGRALLMVSAAVLAAAANLGPDLAALGTERLFGASDSNDIEALQMRFGALPRLAIAPLCGAALGTAGALFQQILRNPLASPSTLGIEAGAGLAIALTLLFQPALLGWSRDLVALGGALFAAGIVVILSARFGFRPLAVILAGLVVGFYLSALSSTLVLIGDFRLYALFIWGSGSLSQQDWHPFLDLLPRLTACMALAALLIRPMTLLQLDDTARGLGLRIALLRAASLGLAVALTAFTVSSVGVIGFLGLAAPAIARALGARRFRDRLCLAALVGACLLTLTDQSLQLLSGITGLFLPAGAVTALLGAPMLFLLVRRLPASPAAVAGQTILRLVRRPGSRIVVPAALLLCMLLLAATFVGRDGAGRWVMDLGAELEPLLIWRLPRTVAAGIAGALLSLAGVILQRLLRNPMASPEVLGVNAGAGLGLLAVLFCVSAPGHAVMTAGSTAGAFAVLALLALAVRGAGLAGNRTLLAGIAFATFLFALLSIATATGDPRAMHLLAWMAGSTYGADVTSAAILLAALVLTLPLLTLLARQIEQLSAGAALARATGARVERIQLAGLLLAGLLTAIASLTVGALSFVGLIAPQIVRQAGIQRCLPQMSGAMLTGAALLVAADFLGRTVHFPWQLPAGLVSALLGGPVLALVLVLRRTR